MRLGGSKFLGLPAQAPLEGNQHSRNVIDKLDARQSVTVSEFRISLNGPLPIEHYCLAPTGHMLRQGSQFVLYVLQLALLRERPSVGRDAGPPVPPMEFRKRMRLPKRLQEYSRQAWR